MHARVPASHHCMQSDLMKRQYILFNGDQMCDEAVGASLGEAGIDVLWGGDVLHRVPRAAQAQGAAHAGWWLWTYEHFLPQQAVKRVRIRHSATRHRRQAKRRTTCGGQGSAGPALGGRGRSTDIHGVKGVHPREMLNA